MLNIISKRFATIAVILIFLAVIIFHALILFGTIPYDMVWGGRLKDQQQMIYFEMVSILLNGVMLMVVVFNARYVNVSIRPVIIKAALWFMVGLFFLNSIGNIFSDNDLERLLFTPLTFLLCLFSLRLAINKD